MKTTKLVYILGSYPHLTATFIEREINTLRQLGSFEVKIVSIRPPQTLAASLPEFQEARKNTLYLIPTKWLVFVIANLYFIFLRPLIYFKTLLYLLIHKHPSLKDRLKTILHFGLGVYTAYLLRGHDFDHIHAHFIDRSVVLAMVVGRLLEKPYSLTAHANNIYVKKILIREKIVNANFMVTVSEHNKAYLLNTYSGLNADKIHVLHPWVNPSDFVPPKSRPPHERFHILSVGRLVEKKGHIYLIEACHLLQQQYGLDFECRIAGDGPLKAELAQCIASYNLQERVYLLGGQPQSEIRRLLESWADIFVLPCVIAKSGDRDGIPVALAEAMSMELPVISTDIVGVSELVRPGAGVLVPPHNPSELANALQNIYAQTVSSRAKMGRKGRAVVEAEFDLFKGTGQLADLFRKTVTEIT